MSENVNQNGLRPPTLETLETPIETESAFPVSRVSEVTPVHGKQVVIETIGISRATLHRYVASLRVSLTCQEVDGRLLFSDEDMAFLERYKAAKNDAMRAGMADTQRERLAQLTAGVGSRREAEELRRRLRGMALPSVAKRVAALLWHIPYLRSVTPMRRLEHYYATFYQTDSLAKLESLDAPPPSTVEREFRRQLSR